MAGVAPATAWLSPMSSTAELHPETLRPGGWTCTSGLVGVSYLLLLLSYTRKRSMRVSSRGIEPLPSDCVGSAGLDKGSNLAEANPSPVPDGPTIDTHEKIGSAIARSRTSRSSLPASPVHRSPRGIEPLPRRRQSPVPDGLVAESKEPLAFQRERQHGATKRNRTSPDRRTGGCPHRTSSRSVARSTECSRYPEESNLSRPP